MDSNAVADEKRTTIVLTAVEELTIRRQADEMVRRVVDGTVPFAFASPRAQAIIQGVEYTPAPEGKPAKLHLPKRDLAEVRRLWYVQRYNGLGFKDITIPKPDVSNREFERRAATEYRGKPKVPQGLFGLPFIRLVSYEAWMSANGQPDHWTVVDEAERAKIGWEQELDQWVWRWVDISEDCPRMRISWNTLNAQITLLTLRQYAHVWHDHKADTGIMLDSRTWCWLATRFGPGALVAHERAGEVRVGRSDAADLAIPYEGGGGRRAEVVKNVA